MGDRGTTNVERTGATTEWDEILISKGVVSRDDILISKGVDPNEVRLKEAISRAREKEIEQIKSLTLEDHLAVKTLEELDDLEDEFDDEGEQNILEQMRNARLNELKEKAARARFGDVVEIIKADWVVEVTQASASSWVLVHLYQDYVPACGIVAAALTTLARKFKDIKIVKIRSTQAVEKWPDSNLPALLMYKDGALSKQILGNEWKPMGGVRLRAEDLEWRLAQLGVLQTELEEDPRQHVGVNAVTIKRGFRGGREKDSDDEVQSDGGEDDYS